MMVTMNRHDESHMAQWHDYCLARYTMDNDLNGCVFVCVSVAVCL